MGVTYYHGRLPDGSDKLSWETQMGVTNCIMGDTDGSEPMKGDAAS